MNRHLLFLCFVLFACSTYAQPWDTLAAIPEKLTFPVVVAVDGKIHIMGGGGTGGATDAHYQYDPSSNSWTSMAEVPFLAQQPAGAVVDGKIHYLGGGYPNTGSRLNDHWVYDPSSDDWSQADTIPIPRAIHEAVSINDQLYVLGGQPDKLRSERYDPSDSTWTLLNDLPDQNFWYAATVELNNTIYRFGGGGYTSPTTAVHRYNDAIDSWSNLAPLPVGNHAPDAAAIGDTIYISGGYYNFDQSNVLLAFDITSQTYDTLVPMPIGRSYHSMVAVDECLYVLGGHHAIDDQVGTSMIRICLDVLYPEPIDTMDTSTFVAQLNATDDVRVYSTNQQELIVESSTCNHQVLNLQLLDVLGRPVYEARVQCTGTITRVGMDVPVSGLYLVRINGHMIDTCQKIWLSK